MPGIMSSVMCYFHIGKPYTIKNDKAQQDRARNLSDEGLDGYFRRIGYCGRS
jgi:hypothetical protein